jgi:DNA-binding SARP family transcriptional activator/TolB-like protein
MHGPAKMLEIKLLGRFRHSGSHDDLPKKAQALLAYLAMNRGHAIPRDQLADLLWSTSGPEQGRQSLRQSLAPVRRALGADARDLIETVGTDVQLAVSGAVDVDVDVHRFEMLAKSTAPADLAAANELYRGEFLAGFDVPSEPFMDWVRVERTRLEATAYGMLRRLVAALSEAGEHDAAIAAAQRLIALDPLREDGHRLLMQLYASVGRRAEAVRQFAICKDSLRRKLDVAPDAKTIALAQAIQAEGPAQAFAAGGGAAEHVPAAEPADAEIPAPAAAACDHVHDVASEAAATDLPMEAGATGRGAAMSTPAPVAAAVTGASLARPAGTKDGVAREGRANTRWPIGALATLSVVAASGSGESLPAAPAAGTRPRAPRPFLRSHSPAGWIWASGLTALLVLVAALVVFRTMGSDGRLIGAAVVRSPNAAELGSPAASADHAAAVSKAVEASGMSAVIVLPFSPTPSDSAPVVRLADLVSNDLINNLARVPGFRVIARSTSLQYAKRPVDVGTLETELGVEYAIEGDVRLEDSKVRINIALINVKTRLQVWAERYERDEVDQVAVHDEIVRALARQLHLTIMAEHGRNGPTDSPSINEMLGRGWAALNLFAFYRGGPEAEQLFQEVLRADPNNATALIGLGAFKYVSVNTGQTREDHALLLDQAESLLRQSSALKPRASLPYYFLGLVTARRGLLEEALRLYEKTLELNPSYAPAYGAMGFIQLNSGRRAEAIENIKYAIRLSPKDNYLGLWSQYLGRIYIELGDDAEAERWLTQSVTLMPKSPLSHLSLAALLARRGALDQAHAEAVTLATLAPKVTLDQWIELLTVLCKQEEHRPAKLIAGLRQAMMSASLR